MGQGEQRGIGPSKKTKKTQLNVHMEYLDLNSPRKGLG